MPPADAPFAASTQTQDSEAGAELALVRASGSIARRPLLFVHGIYHGGWCFLEHFAPYFAERGHPCYALTLRGHGKGGAIGASRAAYLDDVRSAIAAIRPTPLLVGHSMGGMLAQVLLAEGAVHDAVLLATPTAGALLRRCIVETFRHPAVLLPAWIRFDLQRAYWSEQVVRDGFFAKDLPRVALVRYLARLRTIAYRSWPLLRVLLAPIARPRKGARPRVLVVGGREDPTCTPAVQTKIARMYGTTPVIVDGVSHDLMLDAQWRRAADAVATWVADHACA
jgi:pimeloyl-ACP methyl ester carboxylesterase